MNRMHGLDKRTACALVLLALCSTLSAAQKPKIHLTSDLKNGKAETQFDCTTKIYALMNFEGHLSGKHVVDGVWRRPDGEVQENPKVKVDFKQGQPQKVYVYLQLYDPSSIEKIGLGLGGDHENESDGEWRFEAYLDKEPMGMLSFKVSCP